MRLAFASFGIIAPVISVVISVFMLGLASGSWAGGRYIARLTQRTGMSAIQFYAMTELVIGLGAFLVPWLFVFGASMLAMLGEANSVAYLTFSAVAIALSIFVWCFAMGATFPVMMAYVRQHRDADPRSFSHLYFANVLGASLGALVTACVLVEVAEALRVRIAMLADVGHHDRECHAHREAPHEDRERDGDCGKEKVERVRLAQLGQKRGAEDKQPRHEEGADADHRFGHRVELDR